MTLIPKVAYKKIFVGSKIYGERIVNKTEIHVNTYLPHFRSLSVTSPRRLLFCPSTVEVLFGEKYGIFDFSVSNW